MPIFHLRSGKIKRQSLNCLKFLREYMIGV
uniref:Uncharacterized protein n=1 Tax=Siphoviridae sp. ctxrg1 TaxID=2825741 RepID=A0A8S5Q5L4_9CAUD|nr:MAG TPA: hypothetical protein [Siphoviridae sp. ctxrg1]DAQ41832.1 MAG TPA: hypothetical protein [Caudoviricetes sp.]